MKNVSPRHIAKDESDRLGIAHGWYGSKVSGTLVTGVCSSEEECLKACIQLPEPAVRP
jgi:hypothetical protein